MTARFSKVLWGDGLTVTPDADDPTIIRVDSSGGGGGSDGADGVGVPVGGTTGQVLTKVSATDFDTDWETPSGGGGGAPSGAAGGALDGSYPNPGLAAGVAGAGLSEASDVLSVNVDNTTLAITSDSLHVKTDGNSGHYLSGAGTWTAPSASVAHLDDVGDVTASTPADENILMWDAGASAWQARPISDLVTARMVATWQGSLPAAAGVGAVWRVPYLNGSSVTFALTRAYARVETAGAASTVVVFEKSAAGAFSPSTITTVTLVAADNEEEVTSSLGTVTSGQLLRINWTSLGTAGNYTVELEGHE